MFTVTDKAMEMISEHIKGVDGATIIRLYLNQGG